MWMIGAFRIAAVQIINVFYIFSISRYIKDIFKTPGCISEHVDRQLCFVYDMWESQNVDEI